MRERAKARQRKRDELQRDGNIKGMKVKTQEVRNEENGHRYTEKQGNPYTLGKCIASYAASTATLTVHTKPVALFTAHQSFLILCLCRVCAAFLSSPCMMKQEQLHCPYWRSIFLLLQQEKQQWSPVAQMAQWECGQIDWPLSRESRDEEQVWRERERESRRGETCTQSRREREERKLRVINKQYVKTQAYRERREHLSASWYTNDTRCTQ